MTSSQCDSLEQQAAGAAHWTTDQYKELFSREAPERVVLVAVEESDDATVLGFLIARCLPDEWEIENVVVDARPPSAGNCAVVNPGTEGRRRFRRRFLDNP